MPKEFQSLEEAQAAYNAWQLSGRRKKFYRRIRNKAAYRACKLLKKKHSSEYQAYLNRFKRGDT